MHGGLKLIFYLCSKIENEFTNEVNVRCLTEYTVDKYGSLILQLYGPICIPFYVLGASAVAANTPMSLGL